MRRRSVSRRVAAWAAPAAAGGIALLAGSPPAGDAAAPEAFILSSPAFEPGGVLPPRFTADGLDLSPPLTWRGVPAGTKQLAIIAEDLDCPAPPPAKAAASGAPGASRGPGAAEAPGDRPWTHWVLYNVSMRATEVPPGVPRDLLPDCAVKATQGVNDWPSDNIGYRGPAPPPADPPHRYRFRLFALRTPLDLPPGLTCQQLLRRMDGHVLATTDLIATYER